MKAPCNSPEPTAERLPGLAIERFELTRPLLGPESIRAETFRRAVELGVDLSGVPDHLTLHQIMNLLRKTTHTEQAEIAALTQDLWMMIGGRARLRPPPDASPLGAAVTSALRAAELRESAADFIVYIYAIVAAACRRTPTSP